MFSTIKNPYFTSKFMKTHKKIFAGDNTHVPTPVCAYRFWFWVEGALFPNIYVSLTFFDAIDLCQILPANTCVFLFSCLLPPASTCATLCPDTRSPQWRYADLDL